MVPVVYTTKLDGMPVLANKTIYSVESKDVIEEILTQSKPVSKKSINVKQVVKVHTPDIVEEHVDIPNVFENNSEADESDEEATISEDQKVKPTSHLLQKPRSRSYNPIQLCKNPDFNTRLKRLTVSFFTSTRNRRLLKACMPLTIDLHKTFESKLIEGTLYMKSSDVAIVPVQNETNENDHSEQVTVLPSAMPVQCLMDATVTPGFLKIHKNDTTTSVDLTSKCDDDVLERNKVINLRDLSEIRRINQRLLTAEVSPIPLDSEAHTSTIPLLQAPFAEQVNDTCQNEYNNPIPSSSTQSESFRTQLNDDRSTANENNADNNMFVGDDWRNFRGLGHLNRGRGRGRGGKPGPKSLTRYPHKIPLYTIQRPPSMVAVPWNKPKKTLLANKSDDFLITIDTLNKMINKMNGSDLYIDPSKKNKKPIWVLEDKEDGFVVNNKEEENPNPHKEKTSSAPNNEYILQKSSIPPRDAQFQKKTVVEKKPRDRRTPRANLKVLYCCWCKEKLHKLDTKCRVRQKHMCPNTCECCCRFELAEAMCALGKPINKIFSIDDSIVLSDEDDLSPKSISAPAPLIRVVTVESMAKRKVTSKAIQVGNSDGLSSKQGEVNAAVDSILDNTTSPTLSNTNNNSGRGLHLTVGAIRSGNGGSVCSVPVVSRIEGTSEFMAQVSTAQISEATAQSQSPPLSPIVSSKKKVTIWPHNKKPPVLLKRPIVTIKRKDCKTLPKCYTVVSNSKSLQETQVKNDEKVLLLSSKSIVDRRKQCPIFLGKNKILLSTVRMPRETDITEVDITPSSTPPQETQTDGPILHLPQGVQLVLMPSGELTYTLEPGVTLNDEELLAIPNIISVVQQQIAHQIQHTPSMPQEVQSITLPVDSATLVQDKAPENQPILEKNQSNSQDCTVLSLENVVSDSQSTLVTAETNSNEQMTNLECSPVIQKKIDAVSTLNDSTERVPATSEQENTSWNISKESDTNIEDNAKESGRIDEAGKSVPKVPSTRNLLSDLMEMSGISAADSLPAPQNLPLEHAVAVSDEGTAEKVPDMITRIAEALPSAGDLNAIRTHLQVSSPATTLGAVNMPELTPISSLAELKYACDYNAQFFKLDLDTGVIVPINVAIKKSLKPKATPITKSIIDLTNDEDDDTAITVSNIQDNDLSYQVSSDVMNKIPDISSGVKPLKLFKAIRKIKPSDLTQLQQKAKSSIIASNTRKRKQRFDKRQPCIDLVGAVALMDADQHFLNSTDDENASNPDKIRKPMSVCDNFNDSSDDEPLAVISKKMKKAELCNNPTKEHDTEKSEESRNLNNTTEEAIIKKPARKLAKSTLSQSSIATDNRDNALTEDGVQKMDTEEDTFLEEVEDNDSQEDCILGV